MASRMPIEKRNIATIGTVTAKRPPDSPRDAKKFPPSPQGEAKMVSIFF